MIQKSAKVGKAIQLLEEKEELSNEQISFDLNVSPQMVSHMKNDRRVMQQDVAKKSIATYDNPEYIATIIREFSGGLTTPVLQGKNIERHRLSLAASAVKEMSEAIQSLKNIMLVKPPESLETNEKQEIERIYDEIHEATIFGENLLMQFEHDYHISKKKRIKLNTPRWKARGWVQ